MSPLVSKPVVSEIKKYFPPDHATFLSISLSRPMSKPKMILHLNLLTEFTRLRVKEMDTLLFLLGTDCPNNVRNFLHFTNRVIDYVSSSYLRLYKE